jgi:undecaprenyl diphosphate synthase
VGAADGLRRSEGRSRYGAEHLEEVLGWCAEMGISHVTVFVASVDNVMKRDSDEVDTSCG